MDWFPERLKVPAAGKMYSSVPRSVTRTMAMSKDHLNALRMVPLVLGAVSTTSANCHKIILDQRLRSTIKE